MNQLGCLLQVQALVGENISHFEVSHHKNMTYAAIFDKSAEQIIFAGDNICYVSTNDSKDKSVKILDIKKRDASSQKIEPKSIEFKAYNITGGVRLNAG